MPNDTFPFPIPERWTVRADVRHIGGPNDGLTSRPGWQRTVYGRDRAEALALRVNEDFRRGRKTKKSAGYGLWVFASEAKIEREVRS